MTKIIGAAAYLTAELDLAANTADQVVVAAPGADKQIWVYRIFGTAGTGIGTITFEDEDNNEYTGDVALIVGGQLTWQSQEPTEPLFRVATNKALEADTVTLSFDGIIGYRIVDV